MSIVELEDERATGSVSCPFALWEYSRGIVAITRLRKKLGTHSTIRRNTDQNHTQPQNSMPFFSLVLQWFVVLILLVLANALWMRYRRTRRRIHRISSIRDTQRTPTTNVDDANWYIFSGWIYPSQLDIQWTILQLVLNIFFLKK